MAIKNLSNAFKVEVENTTQWTLPNGDNSSIGTDLIAWNKMKNMLAESSYQGSLTRNGVVSTYSLVYTNASGAYTGGVLAPNGDIHFVPLLANRGQKVAVDGTVSTYSLVYIGASGAYYGGVLAPNGDIHFIPYNAAVGQKICLNNGGSFSLGICMSPFFNKF